MKNKVKIACAAVLTGTMVMGTGMPGLSVFNQNIPGVVYSVKAAESAEQEADETDRSGNVYVEASADGTARKLTVTEGLEGSTAAEEVPVSVKIRYYLDGKEMSPEEMAGVSGKVTIRFEYENLTKERVEVEGKQIEVQVPFLVISAIFLPTDSFSNIEVSDGKVISADEQNIVAGIAFPGLADSLRLQDYEPTEEISIPDAVEVTADVTDFELELTATIVTPCGLSEMDMKDLDDIEELTDAMDELTDASAQLTDGIGELYDGMCAFQSYLSAYASGVEQVNEGAKALADGLAVMDNSKDGLLEGAEALQAGLESLQAALDQISLPSGGGDEMQKAAEAAVLLKQDVESLAEITGVLLEQFEAAASELDGIDLDDLGGTIDAEATRQAREQAKAEAQTVLESVLGQISDEELPPEMKEQIENAVESSSFEGVRVSGAASGVQQQIDDAEEKLQSAVQAVDTDTLAAIIKDMQTQAEILCAYGEQAASFGPQLAGLNTALAELKNGVGALADGSSQLTQGIAALNQGIGEVSQGASALSGGVTELASAGGQLGDGFSILTAGTSALWDGMKTFDREGIQELSKLAGEDLTGVVTRFKALKEAEKCYNQKAGIEERGIESIKFIIETEEITD